ncbi:MAG: hypothetical protein ACLGPL_12325 [Acidobacteriota bacterium]
MAVKKTIPVKRPAPKEWATLRLRYESGDRVADLSGAYGITKACIYNRARREGWKRGGASAGKVQSVAPEGPTFRDGHAELASRAAQTHCDIFAKAQAVGMKMLAAIERQLEEQPEDALSGKIVYQFNMLMRALITAINGDRTVLRLNDRSFLDESAGDQGVRARLLEIMEAGIEAASGEERQCEAKAQKKALHAIGKAR